MVPAPSPTSESTYLLYRRGVELLADGDSVAAIDPLAQAAERAPEKTSIRETLGRAYFAAGRFRKAATEFAAVVETYHVNDYAHHCLGRALDKIGDLAGARHHLALAANLRPDRRDYRYHLDRVSASGPNQA